MSGIHIETSPSFTQSGPTTAIRGGVNEAYVAPVLSSCQTGEGNVSPTVGAAAGSVNAQSSYAPRTQHVSTTQGYFAPQTLWNEQHCFAPHLQAVAVAPQAPAALPPLPAAPPGYTIVRGANGLLRMLPLAAVQGVPPSAPQSAGYPGAPQPAFGGPYSSWLQPAPFGGGMPPGYPAGNGAAPLQPQPQQAFHMPAPTAPGYAVPPEQPAVVCAAPPPGAQQLGGAAVVGQPPQAAQAVQQPPVPLPVQPPAAQPPVHVPQPPQSAPMLPADVPQPAFQPQPAGSGGSAAAPPPLLAAACTVGGGSSVPEVPSAPPMPPDLL